MISAIRPSLSEISVTVFLFSAGKDFRIKDEEIPGMGFSPAE
jgi:hypothetical protein